MSLNFTGSSAFNLHPTASNLNIIMLKMGGSVMAAKYIIQKFKRPPKHYSCIKNCRHTSVKANGNDIKMKPAAHPLQAVSIRWETICNIQHYSFSQLFICHWVQLPFRNLVPAVTVPPTPASTSNLSSAACNRGGESVC